MARKTKPIRSDIAWSTHDRIEVHGKSLPDELLGHINLGDMAFLQILGRMPTPPESRLFNAVAVTLVEHGITPSALAARLTYAGAPESLQAAVAAGLCGLGTVFVGSTEGTAKMLYEALPPGVDPLDQHLRRAVHVGRHAVPSVTVTLDVTAPERFEFETCKVFLVEKLDASL